MALTKSYSFEEGTNGAAPAAGGDYLTGPVGSVVYSTAAAVHGALGLRCVNGGYLPLVTSTPDTGAFRVSFIPRTVTTGVPRIITLMDGANSFIGMVRCHTDGKFDLANGSSTRVAASSASWVIGTKYWAEGTLSGTGTARTMQVKVYDYATGALVWDSGAVAVTAATSGTWARARAGAQGGTTGGIDVDYVAFFDTVAFPGPVPAGSLTGNLPALVASIVGSAEARGAAAGPLPAFTASFTGRARATGAAAGVLAGMVAAFTGATRAVAAAVGALPALVGSLSARVADRGAADGSLPSLTGSFAGTVTESTVTAGLDASLPEFTGQVIGTVAAAGPTLDLEITAEVERDRYGVIIEPDQWTATVEPDRYRVEVEP